MDVISYHFTRRMVITFFYSHLRCNIYNCLLGIHNQHTCVSSTFAISTKNINQTSSRRRHLYFKIKNSICLVWRNNIVSRSTSIDVWWMFCVFSSRKRCLVGASVIMLIVVHWILTRDVNSFERYTFVSRGKYKVALWQCGRLVWYDDDYRSERKVRHSV